MPNFISRSNDRDMEEKPIDIGAASGFSRVPYAGLYPKDYQIPQKLTAFRKELDERIDSLFAGELDAGNGTGVDNFITSGIAACTQEINAQHAEHQRLILDLISRWTGDICDGQEKIMDYQKEHAAIEEELAQAKKSLLASNVTKRRERSRNENIPSTEEENGELKINASQ